MSQQAMQQALNALNQLVATNDAIGERTESEWVAAREAITTLEEELALQQGPERQIRFDGKSVQQWLGEALFDFQQATGCDTAEEFLAAGPATRGAVERCHLLDELIQSWREKGNAPEQCERRIRARAAVEAAWPVIEANDGSSQTPVGKFVFRDSHWQQVYNSNPEGQLLYACPVLPAIEANDALHPSTADLVDRFAAALEEKLAAAEKKYGYSDGWASSGWMDECRAKLIEHVHKGDPLDVAAYCAFLWHHGECTELDDQFIYDATGKWPTKPAPPHQPAAGVRASDKPVTGEQA